MHAAPPLVSRPGLARLAGPLATACACVAGIATLAVSDPETSNGAWFPDCPFLTLTGWHCPGCGITRALGRLVRGDVVAALGYNLFLPLIVGLALISWWEWMRRSVGRPVRRGLASLPLWTWAAVTVAFVGFGVVRNLPTSWGQTLAP